MTRGKVEGGGKAMRGGVTRRVTTKGKTMRRETTNDDEATRRRGSEGRDENKRMKQRRTCL